MKLLYFCASILAMVAATPVVVMRQFDKSVGANPRVGISEIRTSVLDTAANGAHILKTGTSIAKRDEPVTTTVPEPPKADSSPETADSEEDHAASCSNCTYFYDSCLWIFRGDPYLKYRKCKQETCQWDYACHYCPQFLNQC